MVDLQTIIIAVDYGTYIVDLHAYKLHPKNAKKSSMTLSKRTLRCATVVVHEIIGKVL